MKYHGELERFGQHVKRAAKVCVDHLRSCEHMILRETEGTRWPWRELLVACENDIPNITAHITASEMVRAFEDIIARPLIRQVRPDGPAYDYDYELRYGKQLRLSPEDSNYLEFPLMDFLPRPPHTYKQMGRGFRKIVSMHAAGRELNEMMKAALIEDVEVVWHPGLLKLPDPELLLL